MATITHLTKHSATLTRSSVNSAAITNSTKGLSGSILATAGLYRGFGAFTYAGGEILIAGGLPVITHSTKN